ncbi:MAG: hypothetical protein HZB51_12775 [Chloroflexi bacterium]|nr:hypothetical protein [Chloroflexota bacterium]
MKQRIIFILLIGLLSTACGEAPSSVSNVTPTPTAKPTRVYDPNEILKISVFKSGEIRVDDKIVTLQKLDTLLTALDQKNGIVWYYREAGESEPQAQALEVIKLIVTHKRPMSLSSKPDFSDRIDATGNSVPRTK